MPSPGFSAATPIFSQGRAPSTKWRRNPACPRALGQMMANAIRNFPDRASGPVRYLSLMPSFFPAAAYVFLQCHMKDQGDYETEYRPIRRGLLEIACGAAKLKLPNLKKVIGIAIDAPKYHTLPRGAAMPSWRRRGSSRSW